ncbi:MAG TPA: PilZ domain-containing protein [Candidatus Saccharimonadales bacterium]|nr:PilZ domain-containing protein [Candidatus Saccharimonadales bacterium]
MSGYRGADVDAPKRKWKRVKVDVRVRIRRWEDPDHMGAVVRTYELSEGGMSVYASETLDVGTFLMAELGLPGSTEQLRLRAVVRNRRGFRCGMEFVDPPPAARAEIARYLKELADVIEI